jgi:hypothetical protein
MILLAKHFNKLILFCVAGAGFVAPSVDSQAQEIYYFGTHVRDLEVSAEAETLLAFPVPPFARVCQPAGIVELYPLESTDDLDNFLIPRGIQSSHVTGLPSDSFGSDRNGDGGGAPDIVARHLKLVPKRTSGSTTCAIRLTNEQIVNVRIVPTKMISKPIVEFRSIIEKARSGAVLSQALGPINLFRAFVSGGDLTFLAEETPSESHHIGNESSSSKRQLRRSTSIASYRLVYVGTDKDLFKAWKFEGRALLDFSATQSIKDAKLGEFYFSTFRARDSNPPQKLAMAPPTFRKGQEFLFYVLTRGDISPKEILERLP